MVCIHFRGVEIYDSLTKILSNNALHPPGPGTKSYVGVLGPNSNFSHQLLQCCMKLRITPAKYQSLVIFLQTLKSNIHLMIMHLYISLLAESTK